MLDDIMVVPTYKNTHTRTNTYIVERKKASPLEHNENKGKRLAGKK